MEKLFYETKPFIMILFAIATIDFNTYSRPVTSLFACLLVFCGIMIIQWRYKARRLM